MVDVEKKGHDGKGSREKKRERKKGRKEKKKENQENQEEAGREKWKGCFCIYNAKWKKMAVRRKEKEQKKKKECNTERKGCWWVRGKGGCT